VTTSFEATLAGTHTVEVVESYYSSSGAGNTSFTLTVVDDGPTGAVRLPGGETAPPAALTTGLGLDTTRQLLAHLYGDTTRLDLLRDGGWTRVVVEVPYHLAPGSSTSPAEVAA
jgi:hypothetical protein